VPTLREINTQWVLPGGNATTVMWFDNATAVATQRTAIHALFTSLKTLQATTTSYTIDTAGREVDEATGQLVNSWSEGSSKTGTGTGGANQLADATQILVQWRTSTIAGSRFVRGRTFLPGISTVQLNNGNVLAAAQTAVVTAGNTFAGSGAGFVIYRRPVSGSGGLGATVSSATCWSEFAVMRKRRS